jgi:hypothetical protein
LSGFGLLCIWSWQSEKHNEDIIPSHNHDPMGLRLSQTSLPWGHLGSVRFFYFSVSNLHSVAFDLLIRNSQHCCQFYQGSWSVRLSEADERHRETCDLVHTTDDHAKQHSGTTYTAPFTVETDFRWMKEETAWQLWWSTLA